MVRRTANTQAKGWVQACSWPQLEPPSTWVFRAGQGLPLKLGRIQQRGRRASLKALLEVLDFRCSGPVPSPMEAQIGTAASS